MRRMKASEWRLVFFAEPRPSETWLTKQLREGVIPGEKLGGIWFVHVHDHSNDPFAGEQPATTTEAAAAALIEDWMNGAQATQQKAS